MIIKQKGISGAPPRLRGQDKTAAVRAETASPVFLSHSLDFTPHVPQTRGDF